ncbi:MAG: fasciclin domain-containing protein [Salinivirgaceae bacterium]|nr:fasciclin domain-containing protein [Salinivirgaceae bacterium]
MKINAKNIICKLLPVNNRITYKGLILKTIIFIYLALFLNACVDDNPGDSYYTFSGETIGEYITNRPDEFSEFTKMLEKSGTMGLLKAYGKYTCFLPTNTAIQNLYQLTGKETIDDFSADSIKKIVYDHIIKDFIITSDDFIDGFLPNLTMSGRYVKISYQTESGILVYFVNADSRIEQKNVELHNGVVHTIDVVLMPTENSLVEAIASDDKFVLFYQALQATHLADSLIKIKDDSYLPGTLDVYEGVINGIGGITHVPSEKKYGFTALLESDETFNNNGITNLDELKAFAKSNYDKIYPNDAAIDDITNPKNSLNRFVAYHLVNKKLPAKLFIEKYDNTGQEYESKGETHSIKTQDMYEYIETMCANTLIEVRTLRITNEYNILNMIEETGEAIRLTADYDNDALNGVYHEIDHILVYSQEVDRMLSSKRLRMDAASFFPELTNNNMRVGHATPEYPNELWIFPSGYIERIKTSNNTMFQYFNSDDRFLDYQGDEVFLKGMYDFEITTPPIPAGTYEVRFGYQPTGNRGAAQLYWDGQPTGIPLDLRLLADNPKIGYELPGLDANDPDGFENDKMMRNRGYMKAPASFKVIDTDWYSGSSGRMSPSALRRILGIYTFTEPGNHVFSVKAVRSGEFMFDYLEFVPIEVLEFEDIY